MMLGESDIDMDEISDHRTVMIECVSSNCEFSGNLSISSKYYRKYLQIIIQNIQFKDTTFHLSNVNIQFINTYFFESRIQDKSELWPRQFTELNLKFSRVHFDGSDENNQPIILTIMYTLNTMVHFEETKITNSIINVNSGRLWLKIDDTIFYDSVTFLNSISLCFAYLQNVTISNQKIVNTNKVSFTLNSEKLYLEILNSKLENADGGFFVNKTFAGYLESWLNIKIENSLFLNNTKFGSGAALAVQSFTSNGTGNQNYIHVFNSTFRFNKALRKSYHAAYGGAISIQTLVKLPSDQNTLLVNVVNCTFLNNYARDAGGAIYTKQDHIELKVFGSKFSLNDPDYSSYLSTFILAYADRITVENTTFNYQIERSEKTLFDLSMTSGGGYLDFNVVCHSWHELYTFSDFQISSETKKEFLENFGAYCVHCPPSLFFPSEGICSVTYFENSSNVDIVDTLHPDSKLDYFSCPYGADCNRPLLRSKPNFWGCKFNNKFTFHQCPVGYCCRASSNSPCPSYNMCSANRTGILCGTYKEGYALSIMSTNCLEKNTFDAQWFWAVGFVAMAAYMLWYTFKDDILGMPSYILKILFEKCMRKSGSMIDHDVENNDIEKGYFGILTYFVQAASMMKLSLDLETSYGATAVVQEIEKYVDILLSIELS